MDSQKRLLLALALSFAVTTAYVYFFAPAPAPDAAHADAGVSEVAQKAPPPLPVVAPSSPNPGSGAGHSTDQAPVREVFFSRPQARYALSTNGGGLSSATLEGGKLREQERVGLKEGWDRLFGKKATVPPPMNLAIPPLRGPTPLSVSIDGSDPLSAETRYSVVEESPHKVVLRAEQSGWEVVKTFQWPDDGFELLYTLNVKNVSTSPRSDELRLYFSRGIDPKGEEAPSYFGGVGNQASAACRVGDDLKKRTPSDKPPDEYKGPLRFIGVDHQYFLSAVFPLGDPLDVRCVLEANPTERMATAAIPLTLAAGQSVSRQFGVYLGPKSVSELGQIPSPTFAALAKANGVTAWSEPELGKTVDFGIWAVICKLLLLFLKIFYGWVHNWGLAIILLTLTVKLALVPLTHRSMVGMEAMKKLQPKVEVLRKKYAEDKERLQLETMKLYQEAKVNPFGSCLLMLVQMPVWIALYTTLRTSFELYNEPFLSPVWTDLTYKDPTYLLPILLGVTMVVTSKLQPPAADPVQARMFTYVMPVFFAFLLLNTPAGLTLYMVTNNVLSILQTYVLRKWLSGGPPAAEPAVAERRK